MEAGKFCGFFAHNSKDRYTNRCTTQLQVWTEKAGLLLVSAEGPTVVTPCVSLEVITSSLPIHAFTRTLLSHGLQSVVAAFREDKLRQRGGNRGGRGRVAV